MAQGVPAPRAFRWSACTRPRAPPTRCRHPPSGENHGDPSHLQMQMIDGAGASLPLRHPGALAGYALPPAVANDPDVGVSQRHFRPLAVLQADQPQRKPDYGGVAVDAHGEFLGGRGLDRLVECGHQRELGGLVADAAVVIGRNEFLGEELLDERDVLAVERLVPAAFQGDEHLLVRLHPLRECRNRGSEDDDATEPLAYSHWRVLSACRRILDHPAAARRLISRVVTIGREKPLSPSWISARPSNAVVVASPGSSNRINGESGATAV